MILSFPSGDMCGPINLPLMPFSPRPQRVCGISAYSYCCLCVCVDHKGSRQSTEARSILRRGGANRWKESNRAGGGRSGFLLKVQRRSIFVFFCPKMLNYCYYFYKDSIMVKQMMVKITNSALWPCATPSHRVRVKMLSLSCRPSPAAARRVNEDVEELLAAVCVGPPAAQQGQ